MQDLVIIPTYERPEMLWLCLDYMAASPDSSRVSIRLYVDAHLGQPQPPLREIETVVAKFPQLPIQIGYRHPHGYHGNSFNVLMAYKDALATEAQYVFMVEDDVLIRPQFFAWHRYQHAVQELGCSIGVDKQPQHSHYASMGVCFRREILRLVMPHCQDAYFKNMRYYCRHTFPPSKVDCEQDGLWCRVLKDHQIVWADPTDPMAQHVGWYGYHRRHSIKPTGNLDERYRQIKTALATTASLRGWVRDFGDIYPIQAPCT